jgi:hypothetical protein
MRTFDVVLTQHTVENIKETIAEMVQKCASIINFILAKKEEFLTDFIANNPYAGHSWRKCGPSRITITDWIGDDETIMAKCIFLRELYSDLKLVAKVLNTNEYADEIFELVRFFALSRDKDEELMMWEAIQYAKARTEWEQKDAEWIVEKKLASEHTSHKTRKEWELLFQKDPDAKKWYNGIIPDTETTCKLCVKDGEFKRKQEEFAKNEEERMEKLNAEYELSKKKERVVVPREIKTYECEECEFKCSNQHSFNDHNQSTEHKTRMRYCKVCEVQYRYDTEYTAHLTSRKHKLAIGEIDDAPKEYHCETCEYKTTRKSNYNLHCATKAHIEKTKE